MVTCRPKGRFQEGRRRPLARLFSAVVLLGCVIAPSSFRALAQAQYPAPPQEEGRLVSQVGTRLRDVLQKESETYLSKRFSEGSFSVAVKLSPNEQKLREELAGSGSIEEEVFIRSLTDRDYASLRRFVSKADVKVTVAESLGRVEAKNVVEMLQEYMTGGDAGPESFSVAFSAFVAPEFERQLRLQADFARALAREQEQATMRLQKEQATVALGIEKERLKGLLDIEVERTKARNKEVEEKAAKAEESAKAAEKRADDLNRRFSEQGLNERLARLKDSLLQVSLYGGSVALIGILGLLVFGFLIIVVLRPT